MKFNTKPKPPAPSKPVGGPQTAQERAQECALLQRMMTAPAGCPNVSEHALNELRAYITAHAQASAERERVALASVEIRAKEIALDMQMKESPEPTNPTLWRYLDNANKKQVTYHTLAAHKMPDGGYHFYIHPQSVSGETEDYLIWPDPFNWSDMLVNKKDSPAPDIEKFKALLRAATVGDKGGAE